MAYLGVCQSCGQTTKLWLVGKHYLCANCVTKNAMPTDDV